MYACIYKQGHTHTCVFKEALTSCEVKQLILLKVSAQFILLEGNYALWGMSSLVQCYFFLMRNIFLKNQRNWENNYECGEVTEIIKGRKASALQF